MALSSDSSYRFERGVDKAGIVTASNRAVDLIVNHAGGEVGTLYDVGDMVVEGNTVTISTEKTAKLLGVELQTEEIEKILTKLGVTIKDKSEKSLTVVTPTFREDLKEEIDLVEEIARIYGYHKIPAKFTKIFPQIKRKDIARVVLDKLYEILPALGLNEIMTYSLINQNGAEEFKGLIKNPVELVNPLSEEHRMLTPHLVDGMLKSISWNLNRKNNDLKLFEIGKVYSAKKKDKVYDEEPVLCVGLTGKLRENWVEGTLETTFYNLKGILEEIAERFNVEISIEKGQVEGIDNCATIKVCGKEAGFMGEVSLGKRKKYDIEQTVYIAQISVAPLIKNAILLKHYHAIPKFPTSSRDISVLCDKSLEAAKIHDVISETGSELVKEVTLIDIYQGEQIQEDKKSLTFSMKYGLDFRTLKEEEIETVHEKIKETLSAKLGVTFR